MYTGISLTPSPVEFDGFNGPAVAQTSPSLKFWQENFYFMFFVFFAKSNFMFFLKSIS